MAQELVKSSPDRFKIQGLTTLLNTFEAQEERAATTTTNAELDTANAKIAELQIIADQMPGVTQELADLKASFDTRLSAARVELTADAMQTLSLAAKERNAAESRLREAEQKFSQSGLGALMDAMRELVAEYKIASPDFWTLPAKINPLLLSLWPDEWTPRRAAVWCALKAGWTEDSPDFREAATRVFMSAQAQFPDEPSREVPTDIMDRKSFFEAAAKKFGNGCYEQIVERSDDYYRSRYAAHLQRHQSSMATQSAQQALRGEGRVPIGITEQPASPGGFTGEHIEGCECGGPNCQPRPARFGLSIPADTTARPEPEINEVRPMSTEREL
jgi:hypothetical protein